MTASQVELRVTSDGRDGMLLVNGTPATANEAAAFSQFIEAPAARHWDLFAAFGNPSGGIVVKTPEAPDIQN
jgi:hypothetical protein